eukprot:scaffold84885_cov30-Tisochrysis_lutea.AAC.2
MHSMRQVRLARGDEPRSRAVIAHGELSLVESQFAVVKLIPLRRRKRNLHGLREIVIEAFVHRADDVVVEAIARKNELLVAQELVAQRTLRETKNGSHVDAEKSRLEAFFIARHHPMDWVGFRVILRALTAREGAMKHAEGRALPLRRLSHVWMELDLNVLGLRRAREHIGSLSGCSFGELLEPTPASLLVRRLVARLASVGMHCVRDDDDELLVNLRDGTVVDPYERRVQINALVPGERRQSQTNAVVVRVVWVRFVEGEPLVREEQDFEAGDLDQGLRLIKTIDEAERANVAKFLVSHQLRCVLAHRVIHLRADLVEALLGHLPQGAAPTPVKEVEANDHQQADAAPGANVPCPAELRMRHEDDRLEASCRPMVVRERIIAIGRPSKDNLHLALDDLVIPVVVRCEFPLEEERGDAVLLVLISSDVGDVVGVLVVDIHERHSDIGRPSVVHVCHAVDDVAVPDVSIYHAMPERSAHQPEPYPPSGLCLDHDGDLAIRESPFDCPCEAKRRREFAPICILAPEVVELRRYE